MAIENDGTWDPVGSKLRDALRDEYKLCGEECVYVDMVTLEGHKTIDWPDHSAVHALFVLAYEGYEQLPAWPHRLSDAPILRESIRQEFIVHRDGFDRIFGDERDEWGDRHAIIALRGINAFVASFTNAG